MITTSALKLKKETNNAMPQIWTADRKIYKTESGDVCEAKDYSKHTLFLVPGQSIPFEQAEALGLVKGLPVEAAPAVQMTERELAKLSRQELVLMLQEQGKDGAMKSSKSELIAALLSPNGAVATVASTEPEQDAEEDADQGETGPEQDAETDPPAVLESAKKGKRWGRKES